MPVTPTHILDFWYSDRIKNHWFSSTPELDMEIRNKFEDTWKDAARGQLDAWRETPQGCLALVIVLDQFPLNMFRDEALGFSTEASAIEVARHAVALGLDKQIEADKLAFLYMPFMHSEDINDQDVSVSLFKAAGLEYNISFAEHHRDIVKRFGRFPHRNAILGRENTADEIGYLASDNAYKG